MAFRRLILIAVLGILVMASCARRAASFDFDFDREFDHEIGEAFFDDLGWSDDITVIERIGDNVISTQTVAFSELDDLGIKDYDFDADSVSFDFADGTFEFDLVGTGDVSTISADFNSDTSTLVIERSSDGR